jgi:PAS domain S-box-containing protein
LQIAEYPPTSASSVASTASVQAGPGATRTVLTVWAEPCLGAGFELFLKCGNTRETHEALIGREIPMSTARLPGSALNSKGQHPAHAVQFYSDDAFLVDELRQFIGTALAQGSSAVVIATEAHNDVLAGKLRGRGVDLSAAIAEGRYLCFDASELLARFMVKGQIDALRFSDILGSIIARASAVSRSENRGVVAFGEMVALLWAEGKTEAAIQLEKLWNGLAISYSFSLRCAYPMQGFCHKQDADALVRICAEHSQVIPESGHVGLVSENERLPEIVPRGQTEQVVQSEMEWRHQEERFKLLVESVQDYAIFMLNPQGRVTSWNPGAERIKGYTSSEILGKHFSCFYPKEDVESKKPQRLLEIAIWDGRSQDEGWRIRKNGERFWAHVVLSAIRSRTGTLLGFGKITRDLTEQRRAAAAVRRQQERFQLFVQAVEDYALFMLDPDGNIMTWNTGAERIKGYKASEIIGQHFSCFYPEEDLKAGKPARELELAARDGRFEDEGWRLRKDGTKFWANVIITAVRDSAGNLTGYGKVTRDITERMQAQRSLEESQQRLHSSERSLRELSLHLLRTQDEERRRIGREIHDSLGQYLSVLKMKLDSITSASEALQEAAECASLVEECLKEVRTISYLLYPPMLEEMGLKSAIPWYLEGFSKRSGIETTLAIPEAMGRLTRDAELVLFRVLQECLTNVQRHSGSATADIRISCADNQVTLQVTDRGKGLGAGILEQGGQDWMGSLGVGLRGMSERLRQLGGALAISSSRSGTEVRASVPLQELQPTTTASV